MTENIKNLTEQLKNELAKNDEIVNYLAVKDEYLSNNALLALVNEYNVQSGIYDQESKKTPVDTLLLTSIKARIDALYNEITMDPAMVKMAQAENAINNVYGEIFETLQSLVVPEHHDCGGECSSCHGCH
ncbi:MAG: YlbF family regulator [Clostridia bacterium]